MRFKFLLVGLMCLIVTGCNENMELECKMSSEVHGLEVEESVNIKFKGNTISDINFVLFSVYPNDYKSVKIQKLNEEFKLRAKSVGMEFLEEENGIKLIANKDNDYFKNVKRADVEEIKKQLENEEYVCE